MPFGETWVTRVPLHITQNSNMNTCCTDELLCQQEEEKRFARTYNDDCCKQLMLESHL